MLQIVGIGTDVFVVIAYVVVGAGEVRRAHGLAGALLIAAGALVLLTTCAGQALPYAGLEPRSTPFLALATTYSLVRVAGAGILAGIALVLLAKKVERIRSPGPRQF